MYGRYCRGSQIIQSCPVVPVQENLGFCQLNLQVIFHVELRNNAIHVKNQKTISTHGHTSTYGFQKVMAYTTQPLIFR